MAPGSRMAALGPGGLALDEAAVALLYEAARPVAVHAWLRQLAARLPSTPREKVRAQQKQLVEQLIGQVTVILLTLMLMLTLM